MTFVSNHKDTKTRRKKVLRAFVSKCLARVSWLISRPVLWFFPLTFLGLFFFYPLLRILAFSLDTSVLTPENFKITFYALRFTLYQATLSTLLTLLLGLPAAYLFARFDFPGKALLRALTAVPFMLPTVVVAAGFNALLGPRGWLNLGLMSFFRLEAPPIQFVGTLGAILLAHVFYNTTIVIRVVGNALSQLDPRLEGAARSLGADSRRVWRHVTLPLAQAVSVGGRNPGFLVRLHQLWRHPVVGWSRLRHAGSRDLYPGAANAQPAAGGVAICRAIVMYTGFLYSLYTRGCKDKSAGFPACGSVQPYDALINGKKKPL